MSSNLEVIKIYDASIKSDSCSSDNIHNKFPSLIYEFSTIITTMSAFVAKVVEYLAAMHASALAGAGMPDDCSSDPDV